MAARGRARISGRGRCGRRRGLVAFEQERRNFNFFAADSCGFGLAARRGRTTLAAVFFPAGVGVGFVFITAIPCFALNSWPEKVTAGICRAQWEFSGRL